MEQHVRQRQIWAEKSDETTLSWLGPCQQHQGQRGRRWVNRFFAKTRTSLTRTRQQAPLTYARNSAPLRLLHNVCCVNTVLSGRATQLRLQSSSDALPEDFTPHHPTPKSAAHRFLSIFSGNNWLARKAQMTTGDNLITTAPAAVAQV